MNIIKDFAELIELKIYVYTGCVVCINSPKYIKYSISDNQLNYQLSEYAIDNADECCLIFTSSTSSVTNKKLPSTWNHYLSSDIIKKDKALRFKAENNMKVSEYRDRYIDKIHKDEELYKEIKGKESFSEALTFIMDNKKYPDEKSGEMSNLKKKDLAEFIGCDDRTIQNYRNENKNPPDTLERVMLICLALETGPKVSKFLINKSIGGIPDVGNKKTAYELLLYNTNLPLEEWDKILKELGLPPIRFKN